MITPLKLQKGDLISIVAPSSGVDNKSLQAAKRIIERFGYRVHISAYAVKKKTYLPASDKKRAAEFQKALDHTEVKAIFCARGGYGMHRTIDLLCFKKFKKAPKWIVGFSDITLLHLHLQNVVGVKSIHGPMPSRFKDTPKKVLKHLFMLLEGHDMPIIRGKSKTRLPSGILIGGNLSMIHSAIGSSSLKKTKNKVLFIEEVDEYYYAIDRMVQSLKRADLLKGLSGIVVGSFTQIKETRPGLKKSVNTILKDASGKIPVVFGIQSGHIKRNYPFILGQKL